MAAREPSAASWVPHADAALARALRSPRVEVLPLAGTSEKTALHLPRGRVVTVTASPRGGLEPTLRLSERLARDGFTAVPHLAARLVYDETHLRDILRRLDVAGIEEAFVVGGDSRRPVGRFADALGLLESMHRIGDRGDANLPSRLGIAAYPGGHPLIADERLWPALLAKQPLATYVVTQMSFDPRAIIGFVAELRGAGVRLPVYAGLAGRVDHRTLLRISGRIGVGDSARFLRKHRHAMLRVLLPRAFSPDRLVRGLAADLARPDTGLAGLHLYTMGSIASTEAWRSRLLDGLTSHTDGRARVGGSS